jgi:hypothetical protein
MARLRPEIPPPWLATLGLVVGSVWLVDVAWQARLDVDLVALYPHGSYHDAVAAAAVGVLLVSLSVASIRDRRRRAAVSSSAAAGAAAGAGAGAGTPARPAPRKLARRPIPAEPPTLRGKPLAPHLIAARRHLPVMPPPGWSAPMAIDDLGGAWLIEPDDDCRILACLATVKERVVLAVTILPPANEAVAEGHALEHLRHFRDVGEFVPEDVEDQMPGARLYLAELRTGAAQPPANEKKTRQMLN